MVTFDRALMGFSLAVHIVLASIGIALPLIILIAEYIGIRKKDAYYQTLAKRLAVVFVVLFAVGTASGMVVALNISFVWPKFMALVGQVAIMPFYVEAFAFFAETIFLGIYIYSWDKFKNRYFHLLSGVPILLGAALSGVLITMVNAFMNTPVGFNVTTYLKNGTVTGVQPFAVFSSPSSGIEIGHVLSSSYFAGIFIFIAYMAYMLMKTTDEKKRKYYRKGLWLMLLLGALATLFALYSGIQSISSLITLQPEKYAAIEGNLYPQSSAPERIGGILVNNTLRYYIAVPDLQSILATGSPSGSVPGLSGYPQNTWPPLIIHPMFDLMVGSGFTVGGIMLLVIVLQLLKRDPLNNRIILLLLMFAGALAVFILEIGWFIAEFGRQPWIIYNVMLVSDAANYSPSIIPVGILIFLFYLFVMPFTLLVLKRVFDGRPLEGELVG